MRRVSGSRAFPHRKCLTAPLKKNEGRSNIYLRVANGKKRFISHAAYHCNADISIFGDWLIGHGTAVLEDFPKEKKFYVG